MMLEGVGKRSSSARNQSERLLPAKGVVTLTDIGRVAAKSIV
jgi:hypothetical protein